MKNAVLLICLFASYFALAQNPQGFDKMAKEMAGKKSQVTTMTEVLKKQSSVIVLDSRELKEYEISHLPRAIWVGYEKLDWTKLNQINKSSTIVVYCSVGYRSGELAATLTKKGFKNVKNLYGGLFNWANNGGEILDMENKSTNKVHGYDKNWSKWLNPNRVTIVL